MATTPKIATGLICEDGKGETRQQRRFVSHAKTSWRRGVRWRPNHGFHLTGELAGLQPNLGIGDAAPEPPAGEPDR